MFEDEVLAADARTRDLLAHGPVEAMYREHRAGLGDHGARLWTLLVLERWLRTLERPLEREPPQHARGHRRRGRSRRLSSLRSRVRAWRRGPGVSGWRSTKPRNIFSSSTSAFERS